MNSEQLFPHAAPDFSDPLGLLGACHERIFQHCTLVENLACHLKEKGADQEALQAAEKIHRYFSTAAAHHHADEEEELFPRLAPRSQELAALIQRLLQEHADLTKLWKAIEPKLAAPESIDDLDAFQSEARCFADAYRKHAEKENEDLFTTARQLISDEELIEIGRSMAERRGVAAKTMTQA